jgi:hypothetical protein
MMSVVTPHTMIRMIGGRRRFGQRIADVLRAVTVKWWRKWASSSLANREPIRSARGRASATIWTCSVRPTLHATKYAMMAVPGGT